MKNDFYPMWKKPLQVKDELFSETVIVYDIDHDTKEVIASDFGFYNFDTEDWQILGDFSMKLCCWTEIPNPTQFMQDKDWVVVFHKGYC